MNDNSTSNLRDNLKENLLPFEKIKREILVRKEAETSLKFGCEPYKRKVEDLIECGVINIDKPKGPTSHQVSAYLQQILNIKKAGHSGTLDPQVTGVLPITLGKGTKAVQFLLTAGKEYIALMHLHKEIPDETIQNIRDQFLGKIKQLPPVRSAIKRQIRERNIYYFNILDTIGQDVLFQVGTEAGTYIRKLIHDFGQRAGTGAHMVELRRTKAGPFSEETVFTLQDVSDAFWLYKEKNNDAEIRKIILPIEEAVKHLPKIYVMDTAVDTLCNGANLNVPGIVKLESGIEPDQVVAIMTLKGELICVGRSKMAAKKLLSEKNGIAVMTEKVFMDAGVYPKITKK